MQTERTEEKEGPLERGHARPRRGEDVSIYLSTRSRRINGSAAGNLSRYVCPLRDPLESLAVGGRAPGLLSHRDGHRASRLFEERARIGVRIGRPGLRRRKDSRSEKRRSLRRSFALDDDFAYITAIRLTRRKWRRRRK